jgi:pimeloyl-ACP methyl ester carboxylesterase
MDYILIPGAWMGEWIWRETASRLRQNGHTVYPITLSGLKENDHGAGVRLATHVQDVLNHIQANKLKKVVLVGHSYAGLVVGQAAAQAPEKVAHTVYVEAFLPVNGQSLLEVAGLDVAHERRLIAENSGLWPPPTREELSQQGSLSIEQVEFLASTLVGHPGYTVTDPAVLPRPLASLPSTFIAETGWLSGSREAELLHSLKDEPKWTFISIEGGHWPMLTMPEELVTHLLDISI